MQPLKAVYLALFATLLLLTNPGFADNTTNPPSSFARNTASLAKNTVTVAEDMAITTYIYAKLASQPSLANENIDISTNEGKVTLNGIVNNQEAVKTVSDLASSTSGVKGVDASKMIVAQPGYGLYIKTAALGPSVAPQIDIDNRTTATPSKMTISRNDPILSAAENETDTREQASAEVPKLKTLHHSTLKKKKTRPKTKTKHIKKKLHKKSPLKKHHHKQPVKSKAKPAKKIKTARAGKISNNFLTTALLANKTIPAQE